MHAPLVFWLAGRSPSRVSPLDLCARIKSSHHSAYHLSLILAGIRIIWIDLYVNHWKLKNSFFNYFYKRFASPLRKTGEAEFLLCFSVAVWHEKRNNDAGKISPTICIWIHLGLLTHFCLVATLIRF